MTEVDYGGGGHRTRLGEINRSTCVSRGAPCPRIQRSKGEADPPLVGAPGGGALLLVGVGLPSFLLLLGGGKEGERVVHVPS